MNNEYRNTYRVKITGVIDDQVIDTMMEFANTDNGQVIEIIKGDFMGMHPCSLTDIHGTLLLINPTLVRHCVLKIVDANHL